MLKKYSEIAEKKTDLKLEYSKERPGDVKRHLGDLTISKKILGYKPTIELEEGISRYIKWKLGIK